LVGDFSQGVFTIVIVGSNEVFKAILDCGFGDCFITGKQIDVEIRVFRPGVEGNVRGGEDVYLGKSTIIESMVATVDDL
jgi:hypothetical protein